MTEQTRVALAIGAGDAIGAAFARRFARGGYSVVLARRYPQRSDAVMAEISDAGFTAKTVAVDARSEDDVRALFASIERDVGPIDMCMYNAGANAHFPLLETSSEMYRKVWELGCFGGFLSGREAARHMLPRGRGSVFFTGATASLRGGAGFAAFAGAKFGLRALAQSMARELGPLGIHVAHLIIDGGLDSAAIHARIKERSGIDKQDIPTDSLSKTESIAQAYWDLHAQSRDAWTHELDIRPYVETW
ncbi:MAG: NAD(P)-dependent dehydrogenase (short-subunit alcohol dehydrogenase family) [Gammaproteobacteria bacterium]|jgi:NAD(P)-dependent dehydrogenase (short-subunit alcohol dehydrogenase family)